MLLNPITEANGTVTNPSTPFPPTKQSTINVGFDPGFLLLLYEVVNAPKGTVPANLAPYFGPTGFTCTNSTAKADLKNYGFAGPPPAPLLATAASQANQGRCPGPRQELPGAESRRYTVRPRQARTPAARLACGRCTPSQW